MAIRGEMDIESYDRLFPAQDYLPRRGRPSQDLDFVTGNHEPLPDIAEYVQQAFASAGYGTPMVEATGRYARLVLRLPDFP